MIGNIYGIKIEINIESRKYKYVHKHVDNVYLTEYSQFGMTVNKCLLYFIILFI